MEKQLLNDFIADQINKVSSELVNSNEEYKRALNEFSIIFKEAEKAMPEGKNKLLFNLEETQGHLNYIFNIALYENALKNSLEFLKILGVVQPTVTN